MGFPPSLDDEDMELASKEWALAGLRVIERHTALGKTIMAGEWNGAPEAPAVSWDLPWAWCKVYVWVPEFSQWKLQTRVKN